MTEVLEELGRYREAEAHQRAVVEVMSRELGASHPKTVSVQAIRARLLFRAGRVADAREVVDGLAEHGADNPYLAEIRQLLDESTAAG